MLTSFRYIVFALTFWTVAIGPGLAQPSAPVSSGPPAVLNQTIRGVTVQLSDIHWDSVEPQHDPFTFFKLFYLSYHAYASLPIPLPLHKSLLDYVTQVSLIGPNGDMLSSGGGGQEGDSSGATISKSAYWQDIDPRWPLVAVDIDFLDPAAPARATGRSISPITIADIPVPTDFDKVTSVHVETTTPLGTRVIVEKVKVSPGAAGFKTYFVFRVVPDPEAPDLQFTFSTGSKVVDDTGAILTPHGGGLAGGGDELEQQPGFRSVGISGVPSPDAKTMTLTLDATESSEMLKQDSWYRHFHLLVPLRLLDSSARRNHAPLAVVQGKDVTVSLDSTMIQANRYRTRFTLRDRTASGITWRISAIRGKDDAGNMLTGNPSRDTAFYWKVDGSPLGPDEEASEAILGGLGQPRGPFGVTVPLTAKTLSLEADVVGVRKRYHLLDFSKIPIPAPGQILTLNRAVQDAFGKRLVLRKVGAYSPEHPLPSGFNTPEFPFLSPAAPAGIVAVLAEPPDPKGRNIFDYTVVAANDPLGRHLGTVASLNSIPGDTLRSVSPAPANDPARVRTLFFRIASLGARTFNLRMGHDEILMLDKRETLAFPVIPAPVKN